ncbi:MAG TPA: hypothetical protein VFI19_13435 [Nocardioides sp.]|nr:hypothetical protein [Nocardioides sp.]
MSSSITRRLGAVLVAGALASGLVAAGPSASAAPKPVDPDTSATWLSTQLTGGVVHNDQFDFDDYGLTADVGFALAALEGDSPTLRKLTKALAKHVDSWTTGVDFGGSDVFAGSTAKALVFAQTVGENPKKFGGTNLVKQLSALVSTAGPTKGRIQDVSTSGDFANTIGQSFAATGLMNAKADAGKPALKFLLKQQCKKGFFRLDFSGKSAADQTCDGAVAADRAPDTDATALTLINLLSLEHPSPKARAAVGKAVKWLRRTQKDDGSFGGGPSTEASNANSTGLAGWALASADWCPNAARAAGWLAKLTVTSDEAGTKLKRQRGAVAYDRKAFKAGVKDGVTDESRDQWIRATAQAAPALVYQSGVGCPS